MTDKTDDDLLAQAKEHFEIDYEYWQPEYTRAESDIDFSLGNQWPDKIKADRTSEGRPCLTENRIDVSIIQVVNDIRQTRPAVNVSPQDDKGDVETARVLKGLVRNTEQQSNANNAYDTAAENAVRGGIGWIRVNTKYVDDLSFDQEVVIDTVENPFSILIDSGIKTLDGSDATRGFAFTDMPKEQFEKEYPDAQAISFESDLEKKNWCNRTENTVRVAEYYYKEETPLTLYNTTAGALTDEQAKQLGIDTKDLPSRKSKKTVVKWCKFNGQEILEKTEWPGSYIPIVPVFGKVVWHEGRRKSFSLTYQGRDPQTRYNFELTALTEVTALQPKAPWLAYDSQLTPQQLDQFAKSNVKNFPVLFHTPTYDKENRLLPPPQRAQPPVGSPALAQQMLISMDGIKATLGIFDASLGNQGNETSGRAILARQSEGDNATFHFVDNLATAIRHVGRIQVDLYPRIMSDKTIARILGDDDEPRMVPLNTPVRVQGKEYIQDPASQYKIALDAGKYDVSVSIGPSYASKRQEMSQNMLELFKMNPELFRYAADIYFRNVDWDGAPEMAERAKKMLPPEIRDESPEQAALMQAQQQMQAMGEQLQQMDAALKQKQDNQAFSNGLEAKKLDAEIENNRAKIEIEQEKLALEAAKLGPQFDPQVFAQVIAAISDIGANLKDVGQAVALILDDAEQAIPETVSVAP